MGFAAYYDLYFFFFFARKFIVLFFKLCHTFCEGYFSIYKKVLHDRKAIKDDEILPHWMLILQGGLVRRTFAEALYTTYWSNYLNFVSYLHRFIWITQMIFFLNQGIYLFID